MINRYSLFTLLFIAQPTQIICMEEPPLEIWKKIFSEAIALYIPSPDIPKHNNDLSDFIQGIHLLSCTNKYYYQNLNKPEFIRDVIANSLNTYQQQKKKIYRSQNSTLVFDIICERIKTIGSKKIREHNDPKELEAIFKQNDSIVENYINSEYFIANGLCNYKIYHPITLAFLCANNMAIQALIKKKAAIPSFNHLVKHHDWPLDKKMATCVESILKARPHTLSSSNFELTLIKCSTSRIQDTVRVIQAMLPHKDTSKKIDLGMINITLETCYSRNKQLTLVGQELWDIFNKKT